MTHPVAPSRCRACGKTLDPNVLFICDGCFDRLLGARRVPDRGGSLWEWCARLLTLGRRVKAR